MQPSRYEPTSSAFSAMTTLVDPVDALAAAERLYERTRHGLRFCCENREVLSLEEARKRDEHEERRKRAYASRNMPSRRTDRDDEPAILEMIEPAARLIADDDEDDLGTEDLSGRTEDWDFDPDAILVDDEIFEDELELID